MRKFVLFAVIALAVAAVSIEKTQAQHCSFGGQAVFVSVRSFGGSRQSDFVFVDRNVTNRGFAFAGNPGATVVVNNQRGLFGNRSQVVVAGAAGAVVVNNQRGFRFR